MPRRRMKQAKLTPPEAASYRGPVVGSLANQLRQPVEQLISTGVVATVRSGTSGGSPSAPQPAYFLLFNNDITAPVSNATGAEDATDWANFAGIFDEFRVLGMEVEVPPTGTSFPSASTGTWALSAFRGVEDGPDQPSTIGSALAFPGGKFCSATQPTRMSVKMDGTDEAQWLSTDAASSRQVKYTGISLVNPGLAQVLGTTATEASMLLRVTWRVQFRSVKPAALTARVSATRTAPVAPGGSVSAPDDEEVVFISRELLRQLTTAK